MGRIRAAVGMGRDEEGVGGLDEAALIGVERRSIPDPDGGCFARGLEAAHL